MKSLPLFCAILLSLAARAGEAPRYQLPSELMARFLIDPLPGLSRQGNPRPRYDWRLYGVSRQATGHTRFLFELTIAHFNQLVNPTATDFPFYQIGYFDVSPRGEILPNDTLVPFGDPQLLFPILPEALPAAGDTWTGPTRTVPRDYSADAIGDRWFTFTETLRQPADSNLTARATVQFDRHLALIQTNQIVVTGESGLHTTNRVRLLEYLFYNPMDTPIMVRQAPEYIEAVTRYLQAMTSAREEEDVSKAGKIVNKALIDFSNTTKTIRAPHFKVMIKQYIDNHNAQSRLVLEEVRERKEKKNSP